jgi:hypothetical protein
MAVFYTILLALQLIEIGSPTAFFIVAVIFSVAIYQQIKRDRGEL